MKNRNTKQKQIIYDALYQDKDHPSISILYKKIIEKVPGIGQATVYRNINKLVEEGKIKKITTNDGECRYDAEEKDHFHIVCNKCGRLLDILITI